MAKLLIETSHDVEVLNEQAGDGHLRIEGVFAQATVKNGNGRVYPKNILEQAVDTYNQKFVSNRRALGELNHPDRPFVDPAEAAILIESLEWQGDNVVGKAKVLDTPKGQIVRGLLEGGFNMGVSTRALGSLQEKNGVKYVKEDLMLTAVDCVDGPSGPDCYVSPMVESTWVQKNGVWVPVQDLTEESVDAVDVNEFWEKFQKHIASTMFK